MAGEIFTSTSEKQELLYYGYGTLLAGNYLKDFLTTTSIGAGILVILTIIQFLLSV